MPSCQYSHCCTQSVGTVLERDGDRAPVETWPSAIFDEMPRPTGKQARMLPVSQGSPSAMVRHPTLRRPCERRYSRTGPILARSGSVKAPARRAPRACVTKPRRRMGRDVSVGCLLVLARCSEWGRGYILFHGREGDGGGHVVEAAVKLIRQVTRNS